MFFLNLNSSKEIRIVSPFPQSLTKNTNVNTFKDGWSSLMNNKTHELQ